ncbi:MAG: hypothetical protein JO159_15910 [Acidobacteria bacterium]|nr:hypothetical protein [Acidobacteriota bacterium]
MSESTPALSTVAALGGFGGKRAPPLATRTAGGPEGSGAAGGGAVLATSSSRAELATIAEPILKAMNGDLP